MPKDELIRLLEACTVSISCGADLGTGFFVAENLILTCAHVVRKSRQVRVRWAREEFDGTVINRFPDPCGQTDDVFPDVALISVPVPSHPCVLLDDQFEQRDHLYSFGYPGEAIGGDSLTGECEGTRAYLADNPDALLIKFKATQVRAGLSGSPLLNQRTGRVCGMLKRTRDPKSSLGGLAVRMARVFDLLPEVSAQNTIYHRANTKWTAQADGDLLQFKQWLRHQLDPIRTLSLPHLDTYIAQKMREVREVRNQARAADAVDSTTRGESSASLLEDLLAANSRQLLLITGGPGQGKSTLLGHQARLWLDNKSDRVPLIIRLRKYAPKRQPPGGFLRYLADNASLSAGQAGSLLNQGKAILLLDALDEVLDSESRADVIEDLAQASIQHPNAHIVVTTRPMTDWPKVHRDDLTSVGFRIFVLEDFDQLQASQFLEKAQAADSVRRAIQESVSFARLARKPLLLTLAVRMGKMANRSKLYEYFAETLLKDRDHDKALINIRPKALGTLKVKILQAVALHVCDDEDGLTHTNISDADLTRVIKQVLCQEENGCTAERIDELRDGLTGRDSMLEAAEDGYEFVHQTMMEYFCASAYASRSANASDLLPIFRDHWRDFRWDEILTLICALLQKESLPLILDLLSFARSEIGWRATWLAAVCLCEIEGWQNQTEAQGLVYTELLRLLTFDFPFVYLNNDNEANQAIMIRTAAADRLTRWQDERTRQRLIQEVSPNQIATVSTAIISFVAATWPDETTFTWLREIINHNVVGYVRECAARELARRQQNGDSLHWLIDTVGTHQDPQIRFAACGELYRSTDERARAALAGCVARDPDEYVREEALRVLSWYWRGDSTNELLWDLVQNRNHWRVRSAAIIQLAAASPADDRVKQLCADRAASDPHWAMRHAALLSLRNWRDDDTRKLVLERAVGDNDPLIRAHALGQAADIWPGDNTVTFVRERLTEETDPQARSGALRALLRISTGPGIERELEAFSRQSAHSEIRSQSVWELAVRNRRDLAEPLARNLAECDSSADVRASCLTLVARSFPSQDIIRWLKERADRDHEPAVREAAIRDLGRFFLTEEDRQWLLQVAAEDGSSGPSRMAVLTQARRWPDERTRIWLLKRIAAATQLHEGPTEGVRHLFAERGAVDRFTSQPGQAELQELARGWRVKELCEFLLGTNCRRLEYATLFTLIWMLPDDEARARLNELLNQREPSPIRTSAAEIMAWRFRDNSVRSQLTDLVTDHGDEWVRTFAIRGLCSQWRDLPLRELLMNSASQDPAYIVRSEAILALSRTWSDDDLRGFLESRLSAEALPPADVRPGFGNVALRQLIIEQLAHLPRSMTM